MSAIVPLLQTALWVGLIGYVLHKYGRQIELMLSVLQKRIEAGGQVKLGPFELSGLTPQPPEQQVERANEEIQQLAEAEASDGTDTNPTSVGDEISKVILENVRSKYFRAEDLALRELQYEYQVQISRQVKYGSHFAVDAAFAKNGTLHIVELKYARKVLPGKSVRTRIDSITNMIRVFNWKNVRIVFVAVFSADVDLVSKKHEIEEALDEHRANVDVRCYHLSELEKKFGLSESS